MILRIIAPATLLLLFGLISLSESIKSFEENGYSLGLEIIGLNKNGSDIFGSNKAVSSFVTSGTVSSETVTAKLFGPQPADCGRAPFPLSWFKALTLFLLTLTALIATRSVGLRNPSHE